MVIVARKLAKLSPRTVATLKTPGRHSDGGGLYLVVDSSGAKRWVFIYRWKRPGEKGPGRLREMGLGSFTGVPLEKARKKAVEARGLLADRKDPIAERKRQGDCRTFGTMADEVIAMREGTLQNEKSKARWRRALETYASMGLTVDPTRDSTFTALAGDSEFVRVARHLKRNAEPVARARAVQ